MMFHEGFSRLVSTITDEYRHDAVLYVHRNIHGAHVDHGCWCEPHRFTAEQVESMSVDDMNRACEEAIQ